MSLNMRYSSYISIRDMCGAYQLHNNIKLKIENVQCAMRLFDIIM